MIAVKMMLFFGGRSEGKAHFGGGGQLPPGSPWLFVCLLLDNKVVVKF